MCVPAVLPILDAVTDDDGIPSCRFYLSAACRRRRGGAPVRRRGRRCRRRRAAVDRPMIPIENFFSNLKVLANGNLTPIVAV